MFQWLPEHNTAFKTLAYDCARHLTCLIGGSSRLNGFVLKQKQDNGLCEQYKQGHISFIGQNSVYDD